MLDRNSIETLAELAKQNTINPAAFLAVCEVESGGRLFATVDGKQEPLIRFEGHYFYRLLGASKRNNAVVQGLAHRRAGKVKNPISQKGRWKLLRKAGAIDHECAMQSTSWGIGQVMGAHWRWLDYASVDALVSRARSGLEGQAELMLRFIIKSDLQDMMEAGNWRGFARRYNGPGYRKNRYDIKMERAYNRYCKQLGEPRLRPNRHNPLVLTIGDRGELVMELQKALRRAGQAITVDGDFGPATRASVMTFQQQNGLQPDGLAGPKTFLELSKIK